jgi:cobalt-zinc-cadmium efflux system protein|uniref:Cation transporter n=1 Tax=Desulfomonile tiedjei TaxID=2358 RepID=A0A7C4ATQ4_9BACT
MSAFSSHDHAKAGNKDRGSKRLFFAFLLTGGFMLVEIVGGWLFNSLALLADGGHMLTDALALGMAWVASRLGQRSASDTHTFGFRRSEILAAFLNGLLLWVMVAFIAYEALERLADPKQVQGLGMLITASIGLAVNVLLILVLAKDRHETLNLRGAFLHVLSDTLGSVGAVAAAIAIMTAGWYWFDSLISLVICALIVYSTIGLLRESTHILMEGAPSRIDVKEIEQAIHELRGVCCVYDLHVWSIATDQAALSAHVVMRDSNLDRQTLLNDINRLLRERFLISHSTVQLESSHDLKAQNGDHPCRSGTACRLDDEESK